MFSLLTNIFSKTYNYISGNDCKNEDTIDDVIEELEKATCKTNEAKFEPPVSIDKEGCFYTNGKITAITSSYVVIDNRYLCNKYDVYPTNLNVGNTVKYLAYQIDEDKEIKVSKIISIIDEWHINQSEEFEEEAESLEGTFSQFEKHKIMTKTIVQKVEARDKRLVYAGDICIDLDKTSSDFVPLIGDMIKITCLMAMDFDAPDLTGDLLEVKKIEFLRSNLVTGVVTNFDSRLKTGSINKDIIFHQGAIAIGYMPCVGDSVICECIESEQGSYSWRAISIVPVKKAETQSNISIASRHGVQLPRNMKELEENKNGIEIDNNLTVDLEINQEKELIINIKNTSYVSQIITKCSQLTNHTKSQLTIIRPKENDKVIINGKESVTYIFKCSAKYVGKSIEVVQFNFQRFQIARQIVINVRAKRSVHSETNTINKVQFSPNFEQPNNDDVTRIPGIRPYKSLPFMKSNGIFRVPDILWTKVTQIMKENYRVKEAADELSRVIHTLPERLTFENYKVHFHNLLYLEQIAQKIALQMYTIESAIFRRSEDYLVLEVPGLSEKRPSLIIGDKVIVKFKWSTSNANKTYEGYIHKIRSSDIFVKFNQQFYEIYHSEDCHVSFEGNDVVIHRCHRAVNSAVTVLGRSFLFPNQVVEKEPQYILQEADDESNDTEHLFHPDKLNGNEDIHFYTNILKRRKLHWFNQNLNEYQKNAVKNILMGVARPLPYVIFGPPGTGKTITLCETILQIIKLLPDSRILVATPSNSSANLIAERLLDFNILKPGDLVRLVASYYMSSDALPQHLLPYCTTVELTGTNSRQMYGNDNRKSCGSLLGQHRITIGTCSTLGILYNLGFKPGHFTHVVVDEAGQATEPEILIPLTFINSNSGQVILAGDPLQLGPVVLSKYAKHFGFAQSFLVRLLNQFPYQRDSIGFKHGYDPRLITKLLINYRSLPEILELPNELFYDSELIPSVSSNSEEAKILLAMKEDLPPRTGPPPAIVFHGVNGFNLRDNESPSWYNLEEATQVYLYFMKLSERGYSADDIGIITPYKKQVMEIRNLLSEMEVDIPKVGTVEEFQGQERNIIILSTVRSVSELISEDIKFTLGFVSAPQRLNVAITRARALLIIVGNPYLLSQDSCWRHILNYCINRDCYTGCNTQCISLNLHKSSEDDLKSENEFL